MTLRTLISAVALWALPAALLAGGPLVYPDEAVQNYQTRQPFTSYALPIGPYKNGKVTFTTTQGQILRQVWRTQGPDIDTLDLITPLRAQLTNAGYQILFECETKSCGGFDFRFETDVVDEPAMHVDLGDYRFLSARKTKGSDTDYLGVLVSKSPTQGFIQTTEIGTDLAQPQAVVASTKQIPTPTKPTARPAQTGTLADLLIRNGATVLEGLDFAKGSSRLSATATPALGALASFLADNPSRSVVLVGHTDATGSLSGNVSLSRKRAQAVRNSLIETYGVDQNRLSAEGVGYLAPRNSNETREGREHNRRVEVVLTTTK